MNSRTSLFVLLGLGLIGLGVLGLGLKKRDEPRPSGPFSLTEVKSKAAFTDQNLRGQPTALFFGFTSCPDVCPTALVTAGKWLTALGPDADKLRFVFVTVDPERDTVEKLAEYLSAFDARILGLTGPRLEIERMCGNFGVVANKVPAGDSYNYEHTSLILLLDRSGTLVDSVDFEDREDKALGKLRALMAR
jgi:protein SCO1/2